LVGVAIAAPVTMLLLSGTDELCALVWSPSSSNGLTTALAGAGIARVVGFVDSPFLAFLLCLFTAGAAVVVWLELAMREAAVYIVVLMLPLAFAALVWPARRMWAVRAVEMLFALILSKFAIVAVLGLGGAALDHFTAHGLGAMLAGMVLVLLAAFAPWAVLRLLPLAEVASSAAGSLGSHAKAAAGTASTPGRIEQVDTLLSGIASHVANVARTSNDGRHTSPDLTVPGGSSKNGAARAESAQHQWEDEALEAPAAQDDHEGGLAEEEVGSVSRADLAARATGANADSRAARAADTADPGGLGDAGIASGDAAAQERVPGAAPLWQAPDMSWRPLPLGLDDGWPPDPSWPPDGPTSDEAEDPREASGGASGRSSEESCPGTRPANRGAEQSDPLPPVPDREGPL
jgi:hypothetical protein